MRTRVLVEPNELIFIQSRATTNTDLVNEYAEMMQNGVEFDPAQGVQDESGQVYVWDGLHRGAAAKQVGANLWVDIQPGNRLQAEWLALTANQKHGLRRNREDLRRIVRLALLHPNGVNLSNNELARHCGVSDKTVGKIRSELEASSEIPKIEKRVVTRAGQTYAQDTRHIGGQLSIPSRQSETNGLSRDNEATFDQTIVVSANGLSQPALRSQFFADEHHTGPKAQEFECPHCGQEQVVGINGHRRWCLNCGAEWPTAAAFLAEVQASQPEGPVMEREAIKSRLRQLVSLVEACPAEQLAAIVTWLDDLETALTPEFAR